MNKQKILLSVTGKDGLLYDIDVLGWCQERESNDGVFLSVNYFIERGYFAQADIEKIKSALLGQLRRAALRVQVGSITNNMGNCVVFHSFVRPEGDGPFKTYYRVEFSDHSVVTITCMWGPGSIDPSGEVYNLEFTNGDFVPYSELPDSRGATIPSANDSKVYEVWR